jgi:hypothetical protein
LDADSGAKSSRTEPEHSRVVHDDRVDSCPIDTLQVERILDSPGDDGGAAVVRAPNGRLAHQRMVKSKSRRACAGE